MISSACNWFLLTQVQLPLERHEEKICTSVRGVTTSNFDRQDDNFTLNAYLDVKRTQ